jgi:hypothetical protein
MSFALASLLVAGTCSLATSPASANELLDRVVKLTGTGAGGAKGALQKHGCATQKNGACQSDCAAQKDGHKGAAQKGGILNGLFGWGCGAAQKGDGVAQKSGCATQKHGGLHLGGKGCASQKGCGCNGSSQKHAVAQHHGKDGCGKGGKGGTHLLDGLVGWGHAMQCQLKSHFGNCCEGKGKGGNGKATAAPTYLAPPAYDDSPSDEVSPPPAPVIDSNA